MAEVLDNQMGYKVSSRPGFFLNGLDLDVPDVDPYALLRMMRSERRIMTGILSLHDGLTAKDARDLLSFDSTKPILRGRNPAETYTGEIFDASDRPEGGDVILWWNDLEKDHRYKKWSKSLAEVWDMISSSSAR